MRPASRRRGIIASPGLSAASLLLAFPLLAPLSSRLDAAPRTWYVDARAQGAGTGESWTDALVDLEAALSGAAAGDEIRVARGTYKPAAGEVTPGDAFVLRDGLALRGGYAGLGAEDPDARDIQANETVLTGESKGNHVVVSQGTSDATLLDGFTITQGHAYGMNEWDSHGGGIYLADSRIQILGCALLDNHSSSHGGGLYILRGAPTITDCVFQQNTSGWRGGGGAYVESASPTFAHCAFSQNDSMGLGGGGLHCRLASPSLIGCLFAGNLGGGEYWFARDGGGGGVYSDDSSPLLVSCVFSSNAAYHNVGGGLRTFGSGAPRLVNCTFHGNSTYSLGGGLYLESGSPFISNCIFWGNSDESGTGASAQIYGSEPTVEFSCIQDDDPTDGQAPFGGSGHGNIDVDPLFLDPDGADNVPGTADDRLSLRALSPCIDAGRGSDLPAGADDDIVGDPRLADDPQVPDTGVGQAPMVDLGAYEGLKQGLLLSTKFLTVPEGGTASFTVALVLPPADPVTVTVSMEAGDPDIGVLTGGSLAFDAANHSTPQEVVLSAGEDWDSYHGLAKVRVAAAGQPDLSDALTAKEGEDETFPSELYVDGQNGDDSADGLTWPTAVATIARAIELADEGDIVTVADGTYGPAGDTNNPVIDFRGKALTVRSDNGPGNCIISRGDFVVVFRSGEERDSVLEGFTIRGGDPSGGILVEEASPTIAGNVITENWGEYGDSAVCVHGGSPLIVGNLIAGNSGEEPGAGVGSWFGAQPVIAFTTIAGNRYPAIHCDEESTATASSCILWDNRRSEEDDISLPESASVTYSCVEGGAPGQGNISADPRFVDPEGGNYRLQAGSPPIDAAEASGAPEVDLDGNRRPCGAGNDMGAYERGACRDSTKPFRRGDTTADGELDLSDAVSILNHLFVGGAEPPCIKSADADGNAVVELTDAVRILTHLFLGTGDISPPFEECGLADDEGLGCLSFPPCE